MALAPAQLPALGLNLAPADAAYTLVGGTGYFSMSRSDNPSLQSTRLRAVRVLSAAYGSIALTGQDADLAKNATTGGGDPAPLPIYGSLLAPSTARSIIAEFGSFSMSRSDNPSITATVLRKGRAFLCDTGYFSIEGAPAERDMEMNGDTGYFFLVGQTAGMTTARTLTAAHGTFALTGQESTATLETPAAKVLTAGTGLFSMSRSDNPSLNATTFKRGTIMYCDYGTFTFTGQPASLTGPLWKDVPGGSGSWVYVTPGGGIWTDVDPDS